MSNESIGILIRKIGVSKNLDELRSSLVNSPDRDVLLQDLLKTANKLEEAAAVRPALLTLQVARELAVSLDVSNAIDEIDARYSRISAFMASIEDNLEQAITLIDSSSESFFRMGLIGKSLHARISASIFFLGAGKINEGINRALAVIDFMEANNVDDEIAISQIHDLGERLFSIRPPSIASIFFARESRLMERLGRNDLASCASALLGCTLIRYGDVEEGLEVLLNSHDTLRNYGMQDEEGNVVPFGEALDADFWIARGYHLSGHYRDAEEKYRYHFWWLTSPQFTSQKAELAVWLAELLLENDRFQEAADLLQSITTQQFEKSETYFALAWALLSKIYIMIGREGQSKFAVERAKYFLESIDTINDLVLRTRLVIIEQSILEKTANLDYTTNEITKLKKEAQIIGSPLMEVFFALVEGDLQMLHGQQSRAIEFYYSALKHSLTPNIVSDWQKYYYMADTDAELFGYRTARIVEECKTLREARGVGSDIYLKIAHCLTLLGENPLQMLEKAISSARYRNKHSILFYSLIEKSAWLAMQSMNLEPIACLEQAADILEGLRAGFKDVELQSGALTDKEVVYGKLLRNTIASSTDYKKAIHIIERSKSRALLDSLWTESVDYLQNNANIDRARDVRQQIVREMRRSFTEGKSDENVQRLNELKTQLSNIYHGIYQTNTPNLRSAATPEQVLAMASSDTAVLDYFCDYENIFVVPVVNEKICSPIILPNVSQEKIRNLLDIFEFERNTRGTCYSLGEMFELLIYPLWGLIKTAKRLIIIPHGILHSVPFHALRSFDERYLMEDFKISYMPNASLAHITAHRMSETYSEDVPSIGFAVDSTAYLPLPRLSAAEAELKMISNKLNTFKSYYGAGSTRSKLLELNGKFNVVHIACHSDFEEFDPLLSRIYLADGPIYGYEILGVKFQPRIVILSACNTGVLERRAGDEIFGLVRAFISRGAGNVLATLWKITDFSAEDFMNKFYINLKKYPTDLPTCVRDAQLEMLNSNKYRHPYYWAPYYLIGSHPLP